MTMFSNRPGRWAVIAVLFLMMSGCAPLTPDVEKTRAYPESIVIRVTGYGAYEDPRDRLLQRHRLMAMRASKLDAYRALAERVYGTSLTGSSTVRDMVLQDDSYRALVDSVVRGAKVVSVSELPGGGFETVLELVLDGRFQDCLTSVNYFKYSEDCRLKLTTSSASMGDDLVIAPGVFRELSPLRSRTLESAPARTSDGGAVSNYYYHISKDK